MPDPAMALLAFAGLTLLTAILFWPVAGVVPRVRRMVRVTDRVRFEDVLKQLYQLEYARLPATVESVAGGVQLPRHQVLRLLHELEESEHLQSADDRYTLTEEGRLYALRIIRTHRLWERFLADRTGTRPEEWHSQADAAEHRLSARATEDLAATLGHPVYDPHGDPIPTALGEMPARAGFPLSSLRPGETGVIIHLEDEPAQVYGQLIELGLSPTMPIERIEGAKGHVRFKAGGGEHEVPSFVARNVTVDWADEDAMEEWGPTLSDVGLGDSARVVGISPTCQGAARRRLLDPGLVPGTVVQARMRSASGDPVAYDIRGALIALRESQARQIRIEAMPNQEAV